MEYRVVNRSSERITQKYKSLQHRGVDIGFSKDEENNKIHANCVGIVYEIKDGMGNNVKSKGADTWGNYVLIKHPNGMFTRYAHLKESIPVKKGQEVDENTIIGIMGNTGRSYGRHLHFEVATGYSSSKRINPTEYLNKPVYDGKNTYQGEFPNVPAFSSLKRGKKGTEVKKLQKLINWINDSNLAIDGSFGSLTEKQVKIFQKNYGLEVDGHFGRKSLNKAKTIKK